MEGVWLTSGGRVDGPLPGAEDVGVYSIDTVIAINIYVLILVRTRLSIVVFRLLVVMSSVTETCHRLKYRWLKLKSMIVWGHGEKDKKIVTCNHSRTWWWHCNDREKSEKTPVILSHEKQKVKRETEGKKWLNNTWTRGRCDLLQLKILG